MKDSFGKEIEGYRQYFVFDAETGYIISGIHELVDSHSDGYNIFTRPFKEENIKLFHHEGRCSLEELYKNAVRGGLKNLKLENLRVGAVELGGNPFSGQVFVENPSYWFERYAEKGWWKLPDLSIIPTV